MDYNSLREYLLGKTGAYEDFPFDFDTLVIKVSKRMFALIPLNTEPLRVNLKCDPLEAILLRQEHDAITPGYHMNKQHWNTVMLDGSLPDELVRKMIDNSYNLVVKGLTRAQRARLQAEFDRHTDHT